MIIPIGYAQVNFKLGGNALPRNAQVVIGIEDVAGSTATSIAEGCRTAFEDNILPILSTVTQLTSVRAKHGPNDTGADAEVTSGELGTRAGNPLPPNSSLLVTKRTAFGGRKNRGRMFLPAGTESDTPGEGTWDAAKLAEFQTALDGFLADLAALDLPMVLLHSDATLPTNVLALDAQSLMATQKRRIRRL